MKVVLFVPGFQEDINSRDYMKTIGAIEGLGYIVKFININWFRTGIDSWVTELEAIYSKYEAADTILAGFSYGAMAVFMAATRRSPAALWLFSLSPYFAEDLSSKDFNPAWLRSAGSRRLTTFRKLYFTDLVKKISSRVVFFYGDLELKEWTDISYRDRAIKGTDSKVEIISGVGHDVTNNNYVAAIRRII